MFHGTSRGFDRSLLDFYAQEIFTFRKDFHTQGIFTLRVNFYAQGVFTLRDFEHAPYVRARARMRAHAHARPSASSIPVRSQFDPARFQFDSSSIQKSHAQPHSLRDPETERQSPKFNPQRAQVEKAYPRQPQRSKRATIKASAPD